MVERHSLKLRASDQAVMKLLNSLVNWTPGIHESNLPAAISFPNGKLVNRPITAAN